MQMQNRGLAMRCFKNSREIQHISLFDRAFHYGDGCFTTARLVQGRIELKALHWQRLKNCMEKLGLNADLSLIEQTLQLLNQTELAQGTIKIILSRGEGQRGYRLPETSADVWLYFYPQILPKVQYDFVEVDVLQQKMGLSMPNLVGLKTLNRLEQVLFKKEADEKQYAEALVTDLRDNVIEGVSSNCFFQINNLWITPDLRYNGIHGVMRSYILQTMQQKQIACVQRDVKIEEIAQIQSLFFCNALHPMQIATSLQQRDLDVQPCIELFNQLQFIRMNQNG